MAALEEVDLRRWELCGAICASQRLTCGSSPTTPEQARFGQTTEWDTCTLGPGSAFPRSWHMPAAAAASSRDPSLRRGVTSSRWRCSMASSVCRKERALVPPSKLIHPPAAQASPGFAGAPGPLLCAHARRQHAGGGAEGGSPSRRERGSRLEPLDPLLPMASRELSHRLDRICPEDIDAKVPAGLLSRGGGWPRLMRTQSCSGLIRLRIAPGIRRPGPPGS